MLDRIRELIGAEHAAVVERVQSLWSGYGEIVRVALAGVHGHSTAIVKRIAPPHPGASGHPRGWNTTRSHARKLRSYEVEATFYRHWARRVPAGARVASYLGGAVGEREQLIVLEDLDAAGFGRRLRVPDAAEIGSCIGWLAAFHARFLRAAPDGLWETGTYWHLATRPDELAALDDDRLRDAAPELDAALRRARYRTIVHGDAKLANFCFPATGGDHVAAVDFQYVGGGCGVQDLAYFLGSCLDDDGCTRHAAGHVDLYFTLLRERLARDHPEVDSAAVEAEGRALYPIAWADFIRWLAGWAPEGDHAKLHGYAWRMVEAGLAACRRS